MATITVDTYVLKGKRWVIEKDPNAQLDYAFDWARYLADLGDEIQSVEWVVDPSLTVESSGFDATTATVWLSGGTATEEGGYLRVTCRITTTNTPIPRIDDRSIYLKIVER